MFDDLWRLSVKRFLILFFEIWYDELIKDIILGSLFFDV